MGGARSKGGKGVEDFKPYITRSIPVGAQIVCADNSGAKIIEIVNVHQHYKSLPQMLQEVLMFLSYVDEHLLFL